MVYNFVAVSINYILYSCFHLDVPWVYICKWRLGSRRIMSQRNQHPPENLLHQAKMISFEIYRAIDGTKCINCMQGFQTLMWYSRIFF